MKIWARDAERCLLERIGLATSLRSNLSGYYTDQQNHVGRKSDYGRLLPRLLTKAWRSPSGTLSETATPFFVSLNALAEELKPLL